MGSIRAQEKNWRSGGFRAAGLGPVAGLHHLPTSCIVLTYNFVSLTMVDRSLRMLA